MSREEISMKVGFVGLGKMGQPMATRLVAAGHDVGVYNRTPSKCNDLVNQGATLNRTVAEAANHGDVVVTMLENDAALKAVTLGEGGLLASMSKGAIHVAMGTHSIVLVNMLSKLHGEVGQVFLSAPVLGRPAAAAAGQLGIVAGGPPAAVNICRPLFDALGRRTFDGGANPIGAAAAKIVNNFILACSIEAMGEGIALGLKCDLPAGSLVEILTDGLFSGPAHKIYGKIIAESNYFDAPGFTAKMGLKDVLLALTAGEELSVPLPSANVCRDRLLSAIAHGDGGSDWAVMALEQARASGLA
jgi:3-hydroxyisobutyrate dehydrogenase-like beta-hydroxyacid dehydrogenase